MRRSTPVLFSLLAACASPAGQAVPKAAVPRGIPSTRAVAEREPEAQGGWGRLRIVSRALELMLPNSAGWRYRPGKTSESWVSLTHAASDSLLELWTARAGRLVTPEECEARARLRRPDLFAPSTESALAHEELQVPNGYRSVLTLGVDADGTDTSVIVGRLVLFGAAPLRCLGVQYTTRVRGEGATEEVARRLDVIAHRVIPSIEFRSVDARVPPPEQR